MINLWNFFIYCVEVLFWCIGVVLAVLLLVALLKAVVSRHTSNFRIFVLKLVAAFALPWALLIVKPVIEYQASAPAAYNKDKGDELDNTYYYPSTPTVNRQGEKVYAMEGCVQCHSQMIRPPAMALDAWRKGWGQDQSAHPAEPARGTEMADYFGEKHSFLGVQRNGPDLANVGYRFENRTDLHMHLFAPQALNAWSVMPGYSHLYEVRKIQGQGSAAALPLAGTKFAPKAGYEVVPTYEAETLVSYLMGLKKDYPTPGSAKAVAAAPAKK